MADTVIPPLPPASKWPYIWAAVILALIGTVLIGIILFLRPQYDPLAVIGAVSGLASTFGAAVMALMKSQETHDSVNGRLSAFMAEHGKTARAEGVIEGTNTEQARVAAIPAPPAPIVEVTMSKNGPMSITSTPQPGDRRGGDVDGKKP